MVVMAILVVILVLMLGSANKLKTPRTVSLSGDVTGSASFDGSKNITIQTEQNNIAILTGSVSGSGAEEATKTISYPNGYNKDNCVVIACMINNAKNTSGTYSYGAVYSALSFTTGALPNRVSLGTSSITLGIKNITLSNGSAPMISTLNSDNVFNYKIVLMKI